MPDNGSEFESAWLAYIKATRQLLELQKDDRPLDQYLMFRNKVYEVIQNQDFLNELRKAWSEIPISTQPEYSIREALLIELKAFPLAIEVMQNIEKDKENKSRWGRWLGRSSTVAGSVKDLLNSLPPWAKNTITLFKELIELFRGK